MAAVRIVFETSSTTEDNERGRPTGRLSAAGREHARELGRRRRDDGIHTVSCSDLGRAVETATIAFGDDPSIPVLLDWRVQECDDGEGNGMPVDELQRGPGCRILVIGHSATRWALDERLGGEDLRRLVDAPFGWQEGWEYSFEP